MIFLNFNLIREIESKENKNETEWTLLNYFKTVAIISEILVSESKLHLSSEDAIKEIRKVMNENL